MQATRFIIWLLFIPSAVGPLYLDAVLRSQNLGGLFMTGFQVFPREFLLVCFTITFVGFSENVFAFIKGGIGKRPWIDASHAGLFVSSICGCLILAGLFAYYDTNVDATISIIESWGYKTIFTFSFFTAAFSGVLNHFFEVKTTRKRSITKKR